MIRLWFLRKVLAFLCYFSELAFEYGRYNLFKKLYCYRLKVSNYLVKVVLDKHYRELKK